VVKADTNCEHKENYISSIVIQHCGERQKLIVNEGWVQNLGNGPGMMHSLRSVIDDGALFVICTSFELQDKERTKLLVE
jgi:hypothetical protein